MADTHRRNSAAAASRQQPSRLQRRAPASLQISRAADWKVAIPLLSPLVSPSSPKQLDEPTPEPASRHQTHGSEPDKPPVFKKWLHPAAPFQYDSNPRAPRFVPV